VIRVGIVEDEAPSRALLRQYLQRYERESGEEFAVTEFTTGAQLADRYRPDFDILLLDIEMPGLNGFATAEEIRRLDSEVIIVFITNMTQYAIRGYEVDALSYLLKPVPYAAFAREMKRSTERLRRRVHEALVLMVDGDLVRVPVEDVVYAESVKHRVEVHTISAVYSVVAALKTLEAEVEGKGFFRCNSGYLVNLRHVLAVQSGQTVKLTGGHDLLISRPRKKAFMAALTDYLGGGSR
jgi:DNA-binding LytR/AlgR family response regulator